MMMNIIAYITSAIPIILSTEIDDVVWKWIIRILGIISFLITIAIDGYRLYRNVKKAKADGVITEKEQKEIDESVDQLANDLKSGGKDDKINKKGE